MVRSRIARKKRRKRPYIFFFSVLALAFCVYVVFVNLKITRLAIESENLAVPYDLPVITTTKTKSKSKSKTSTSTKEHGYIPNDVIIDVEKITKNMIKSFSSTISTDDAGASNRNKIKDRSRLEVSFVNPNIDKTFCRCDIISVDCLDSISCIPHNNPNHLNALVWIGLETRTAIKETSIVDGGEAYGELYLPLGKQLQYAAIDTWKVWRSDNVLPQYYHRRSKSIFVNPSWYPDCQKNRTSVNSGSTYSIMYYRGPSCFYQWITGEEDSAGTIMEHNAIRWFEHSNINSTLSSSEEVSSTKLQIRKILNEFLHDHQSNDNKILSPLGNLLMFAHITRIMFNRRPFLEEIYQAHLTSIAVPSSSTENDTKKVGKIKTTTDGSNDATKNNDFDPFIIGLHMRRGDSCNEDSPQIYQKVPSPLDSPAQFGSNRMCYQTDVYLEAIRRIRQLVPNTRPLHVYVATDDAGDVMEEILHHNTFNKGVEVEVDQWNYLNYSRSHFQYEAENIEADENKNQHILGETAVADLWLLSHGHAFIGHLGSRFGKAAWLLATSRHNTFVPFFTVDGHSK
jgi:hypothetical protein